MKSEDITHRELLEQSALPAIIPDATEAAP